MLQNEIPKSGAKGDREADKKRREDGEKETEEEERRRLIPRIHFLLASNLDK